MTPPVRVSARIARLAALVVFAAALTTGQPSRAAPVAQRTDARFGVVEPHDAPAAARELGATWGRARFHWARIQPDGPEQWLDAELTDEQLARELEEGREIVGLLIGVPEWAADEEGLPQGLDLPPGDDGNLWGAFVRETVGRYAGRIDHWIVWNEPDVWDPHHPAHTWPGTDEDYVRLLKVTYLAANEANPDAVIHLAALSHWWDVQYGRELYFPALLDAILADPEAPNHDYYFDVATLHLYFNPASVYEVVEAYRGYLAERGLDKPIWLVETNAPPTSDPAWPVEDVTFRVSLLEQATYMPQALSLALAAGAERVGVYKLVDTPEDASANPEPFGLLRADGSHRPAFTATRTAFSVLSGTEDATWDERGAVAQVIVQKPGAVVRVLWSRGLEAQEATVPALADTATLIDMWGNQAQVAPVDGAYSVRLYAGECQETVGDFCMIGGPPIYLVEQVNDVTAAAGSAARAPLETAVMPQNPDAVVAAPPREGRSAAWWVALVLVAVVIGVFEFRFRRRLLRRLNDQQDDSG